MIRDYQAIQKTWFIKGKQRIVPTYGKHEGVKLFNLHCAGHCTLILLLDTSLGHWTDLCCYMTYLPQDGCL